MTKTVRIFAVIDFETPLYYIPLYGQEADHNNDHYHLPYRGTDGRGLIASSATRLRVAWCLFPKS